MRTVFKQQWQKEKCEERLREGKTCLSIFAIGHAQDTTRQARLHPNIDLSAASTPN